jgi:hypothetical protein
LPPRGILENQAGIANLKVRSHPALPHSIGQGSGALVTASDVLFHGEPDGHSRPTMRTGELLWRLQTGAGADAPAITYEIDGVQLATQTASSNSEMVWAFSLRGNPTRHVAQFEAPAPPPTEVTIFYCDKYQSASKWRLVWQRRNYRGRV